MVRRINFRSRVTKISRRVKSAASSFSFDKIFRAFSSIINRPLAVILIVLAISLYVSETSTKDKTKTIIGQLVSKLTNTKFSPIGDYIGNHRNQTIGYTVHLSAIAASAPRKTGLVFSIAAGLFCFLLPSAPYLEYALQASVLFLFFKLKDSTSRVLILVSGVLATVGGYLFAHLN